MPLQWLNTNEKNKIYTHNSLQLSTTLEHHMSIPKGGEVNLTEGQPDLQAELRSTGPKLVPLLAQDASTGGYA